MTKIALLLTIINKIADMMNNDQLDFSMAISISRGQYCIFKPLPDIQYSLKVDTFLSHCTQAPVNHNQWQSCSHGHSPGGSEAVRSLAGLAACRPEESCRHSVRVCMETEESQGPGEEEENETAVRKDVSFYLPMKISVECGWQSERVHSLPLKTLRSADTDKSAISSTLPSRQRERNRGVVLSGREWAQTESALQNHGIAQVGRLYTEWARFPEGINW